MCLDFFVLMCLKIHSLVFSFTSRQTYLNTEGNGDESDQSSLLQKAWVQDLVKTKEADKSLWINPQLTVVALGSNSTESTMK